MLELRPYQQECLDAIIASETRGITKQLVVLPTGSGKTVIFAELLKLRKDALPALVLAHREELLQQAKEKIEHANPHLRVGIEQGTNRAGTCDVVVGSVPSLGRKASGRLETYPRDYFRTIICDEAHHSSAESYQRVFEFYQHPGQLRIGVTATPHRRDNVGLSDVYDEVVYYKSIEDLITDGYLCKLRGYRVESDCDISSVGTRAGDYIESQLAEAVDTPQRNQLVVNAYKELVPGSKCVIFASSVKHGENLTRSFTEAGLPAGNVFGSTGHDDRRRILGEFTRCGGAYNIIINVGVLTEGFDYPGIESIIFARPTKSSLLYTQCVGRGTRLADGKDYCTVIDIADVTRSKKPHGLPSLIGLPPDFDLGGMDLMDAAEGFNKLVATAPQEAARVRSLEDIELVYRQIDIFRPPPPSAAVLEYSSFIWAEVGPDNFYLGLGATESLHIDTDALGRYHCVLKSKDNRGESTRELAVAGNIREAFATADRWVISNRNHAVGLLDSRSVWRSDSPTDKQIKWLKKYGVPITDEMTKGEASQILDKLFKDSPKKPKPKWLQNKIAAQRKSDWF